MLGGGRTWRRPSAVVWAGVAVALLAVALGGCVDRGSLPGRSLEPIGPIHGSVTVQALYPVDLWDLPAEPTAGPLRFALTESLVALDVRVGTYGRRNRGTVFLSLSSGSDWTPRQASAVAADLMDNAVHRFYFDRPVTWDDLPPTCRQFYRSLYGAPCLLELRIWSDAQDPADGIALWRVAPTQLGLSNANGITGPADARLAVATVIRRPPAATAYREVQKLFEAPIVPLFALLLLISPGVFWAMLVAGRSPTTDLLALSPSFGMASIPILALYAGLTGNSLTATSAWAAIALFWAGTLFVLLACVRSRVPYPLPDPPPTRGMGSVLRIVWHGFGQPWFALLAALVVAALGAVLRSAALDGNPLPPGGDAYHHAVLTQLIAERGRLPTSFVPYAPIETFSYHFGFHAYAALIAVATGASALQAMTTAAVLLNASITVAAFGLSRLVGLGPGGALVAAAVVSLVSPFPTQLLDIARYPQGAALLVLPGFIAVVLGYTRGSQGATPTTRGGRFAFIASTGVLGGLVGAGLFLTHYRVALFGVAIVAIALVGALFGPWVRRWMAAPLLADGALADPLAHPLPNPPPARGRGPRLHSSPGEGRSTVGQLLTASIAAVGAGLIVAPWALQLSRTFSLGLRGSEGRYGPAYYSLDRLGEGLTSPVALAVLGLGVGGLILGCVRRQPVLGLFMVWGVVQLALSNPRWLPLPIAGQVDTVTVVSSLFLPLALGTGYLVQVGWGASRRWVRPAIAGAVVALLVVGMWNLPTVVRPDRGLADQRDVTAAAWIAQNLPADARVLVNATILRWQPDFVVPTDGGYWLPLLSGRATTLLPMLYPAERGVSAAQIAEMELLADFEARDLTGDDALRALQTARVTHVYLGVAGGPIRGPSLDNSARFRRVYDRDGVAIYEVTRS